MPKSPLAGARTGGAPTAPFKATRRVDPFQNAGNSSSSISAMPVVASRSRHHREQQCMGQSAAPPQARITSASRPAAVNGSQKIPCSPVEWTWRGTIFGAPRLRRAATPWSRPVDQRTNRVRPPRRSPKDGVPRCCRNQAEQEAAHTAQRRRAGARSRAMDAQRPKQQRALTIHPPTSVADPHPAAARSPAGRTSLRPKVSLPRGADTSAQNTSVLPSTFSPSRRSVQASQPLGSSSYCGATMEGSRHHAVQRRASGTPARGRARPVRPWSCAGAREQRRLEEPSTSC